MLLYNPKYLLADLNKMSVLNILMTFLIIAGLSLNTVDSQLAKVTLTRADPLPPTISMSIQCRVEKGDACNDIDTKVTECDFTIRSLTVFKGAQKLAGIRINSSPRKYNSDRNLVISGQLSGSVEHFPFLTLDWAQTGSNIEGGYKCQASIVPSNKSVILVNSEPILIVFPHHNVTLLVQQVLLMERTVYEMQEINKELEIQVYDLESSLSTVKPVAVDFGLESFSPLGGLPYGIPRKSKHVRFRKEYLTAPQVSRAITTLDVVQGKGFQLVTYIQNVTTAGFQLDAYVWSDTLIEQLEISWISIGI